MSTIAPACHGRTSTRHRRSGFRRRRSLVLRSLWDGPSGRARNLCTPAGGKLSKASVPGCRARGRCPRPGMTPVAHLLAAALAVWPVSAVAEGPQSVDRLVTAEPALAALDKELQGAAKLAGPEDQKQWLAGREAACPAAGAKGQRRAGAGPW